MNKNVMKGAAAILIGLAAMSCSRDLGEVEQKEQSALESAEATLGFHIPDDQDWVMSSKVKANVSVNGKDGAMYTVKVYSNNPLKEDIAYVLAKGDVQNGETFTSEFRYPSNLLEMYLSLTDSEGETIYTRAAIENGQLVASFDNSPSASRVTRANAVVAGDPFTFESTANYYKTSVPAGAKDINTTSDSDCISAGVLVATSGMRTGDKKVNLWQGPAVDIYINGNVTVPSDAYIYSANFYVLPGATLTMNKQANYVCAIYVASGGTLNYNVSKLETNNDNSGKRSCIYNLGTVNFADNFEANQDVIIYNEGTMTGKDITSKPADGNPSYFYNFGTLTLTGNMILNSKSNFYNEGTVTVNGETQASQQKIYWINKGHYTSGTINMHPWNDTFYNYCQLFVRGEANFHNGAFHLMDNAYIEAASADIDNFIVYMGNNSGFNIKGDTYWGLYGEDFRGKYDHQGFAASGTKAYVRLGGTTTVSERMYALVLTGNITYAINNLVDLGANNSGVRPTHEFRTGTVEADYSKLVVTPKAQTGQCGATWKIDPPTEVSNIWTYAFEDKKIGTDYDMNDVVLKVRENESNSNQLIVTLVAAGCEYDNLVYLGDQLITWNGKSEVHEALGVDKGTVVNTGWGTVKSTVSTTISKPSGFDFQEADFKIVPVIKGEETEAIGIAKFGNPYGIIVPVNWQYPTERTNICDAYDYVDAEKVKHSFRAWAKSSNHSEATDWYNHPTGSVMNVAVK